MSGWDGPERRHSVLESELAHERELREVTIRYERRLSDARDHEMTALATEHRLSHEREHEYTEAAIVKATSSLQAELATIKGDIDRLKNDAPGYMTLDRFDREHKVVLGNQADDHTALTKLLTQIGTLRGIIALVGIPGLAAFFWAIVGAATGHPLTGPNGIVP